MITHRSPAALAALAILAICASPAQAQQAAGYYNPLESSSDFPGSWYMYGYPFTWAIDSSPSGGHSGSNSLNWNNGSDISGDYPYGYWYTSPINMAAYDTPIVSFWCKYDMDADPWWDYREIYFYNPNSGEYYYAPFNIDNDGNGELDLDCGGANQWHEHQVQLSPALASGDVVLQFYTYSNNYYSGQGYEGWFIDDLSILVPDVTAPDAINDLAAANPTLTEIEVSWTSPHDDDVSGTTAAFDLRYSTSPINGTNFSSATQVSGEPAPDAEGTPHTLLITGLTEDTIYFFAVQTTDLAGNVSFISNVASTSTLAPPPPPPSGGSTAGADEVEVKEDILPCSAGSRATPVGLLGLAALVLLAFAIRRNA